MSGLDAMIDRQAPTAWEKFICSPLLYLTKYVYMLSKVNIPSSSHVRIVATDANSATPSNPVSSIRIACISDTHNLKPFVPPADILIHAGDITQSGSVSGIQNMVSWLNSLPHRHKIVIAGNHDICLATADESMIEWAILLISEILQLR